MTKTLWCNINDNPWDKPNYIKVTATKVDELETKVENLYRDAQGNEYITHKNKFQNRMEFTRL